MGSKIKTLNIPKQGYSLPNEILLKVFDYLNISDLNKCALVCKNWNSLSNHRAFWLKWANILKIDKELNQLASQTKSLSLKKSIKSILVHKRDVNLLKLNTQINKKINNFTLLPDLKHFLTNQIELKWYVEFYDNKNKLITSRESNEKNLFESSLSIVWSDLNELTNFQVNYLKIYTSIPVYIDYKNGGKLSNRLTSQMKEFTDLNSTNRILIYETKFNFSLLKTILSEDSLIKLYSFANMIIGVWNGSNKNDLAFITLNTTYNFNLNINQIKRIKIDNYNDLELDKYFGLHDYKIYFGIRNQTSTLFLSLNKLIYKTSFETVSKQEYLLLNVIDSDMSESDMGYHLTMLPKFTWNTQGFKKNIINLISIIDLNVIDSNDKIMISESFPVRIQKSMIKSNNFVSDECYEFNYTNEKKFKIDAVISYQNENAYLSKLYIYLDLNLVDSWFGTKFLKNNK